MSPNKDFRFGQEGCKEFENLRFAGEDAEISICPEQVIAHNPSILNEYSCEPRQSQRDVDRAQTLHFIAHIKPPTASSLKGVNFVEMLLNWYAISIAAYAGAFIRVGLSYLKIW